MQRRITPGVAQVAPLVMFELFTALALAVLVKHPDLPWWRRAPEQWVYPLQTVVVGAMLYTCRAHYRLLPWRQIGLATILGAIGIGCWLAPAWLGEQLRARGHEAQPWWKWLGLTPRLQGFDPTFFRDQPLWYFSALIMRFLRLVIVVPLAEEIFWRSFLMRYLIADEEYSFLKVPFGTHSWKAYAFTTLGVVFVHQRADWLGAFIFGSLMYWLAIRSKSLGAYVWMHAVANLLLGIYVLVTHQWGYW